MVFELFNDVYKKFKMHFYKEVFKKTMKKGESLTTVETFCMEVIYALGRPSISEFADFTSISSANAADKVNNLIKKGYINKVQSTEDKRRYYLEVTPKYIDYYNISNSYVEKVMKRMEEAFSEEELKTLEKMLKIIDTELLNDWDE
ncbi:MAG: MarR family winged helix-turn-helix transcriptional regulator [Dorea sp.]|nr:MarR family winged helix-turn-helix transcriptional regulator [Dorea sp.]